jgi:dTDP-glucose pyrophosphorylase
MYKPTLVILAAGMGSRYGGGGLKQIDPVGPNGEIIMEYSIFDAIRAGFAKVVFVIKREMADAFHTAIDAKVAEHIEVAYAFQELSDLPSGYTVPEGRVKPWGTAHAVLAARNAVHENFAVIGADDFFGRGTFEVLADYLKTADPNENHYTLAGFLIENTVTPNGSVSRGICEVQGGYLRGVTERGDITVGADGAISCPDCAIPAGSVASMNTFGFTPGFFGELSAGFPGVIDAMSDKLKGEYHLPSAVDAAIRAGRADVKVLRSPERWYGVTWREDKPAVVKAIAGMVRDGVYPDRLWE